LARRPAVERPGWLLSNHDSRRELHQRVKASAIERQIRHELPINDRANSPRLGVDQRCPTLHGQSFKSSSYRQGEVDR